jgi:putative Holliday junction resolvase
MDDLATVVALGIDLGRVRMGLAVAREGVALPLAVWPRKGTRLDLARLLPELARLRVDRVVVGLPPDQGDGAGSHGLARRFAEALAAAQERPVLLVDEADTSVEAHAELRVLGLRAARRREVIDQQAAKVILARWLAGAPVERVAPATAEPSAT